MIGGDLGALQHAQALQTGLKTAEQQHVQIGPEMVAEVVAAAGGSGRWKISLFFGREVFGFFGKVLRGLKTYEKLKLQANNQY